MARRSADEARSPEISVLLPVRDAESTIGAALRSVLAQSFTDFECWVVNDGSVDATAERVRELGRRDRRIHLVDATAPAGPDGRVGLVGALNCGLARCRGRFIARMDADDLMHRHRLALQRLAFRDDPTLSAVGSHVQIFPRPGLTQGRRDYQAWLNGITTAADVAQSAFIECPLAHPSLMVRAAVFGEFTYRDQGWPEDYDLLLRLLAAGHRLASSPSKLLFWRDQPERLSRRSATYSLEQFARCKAAFLSEGLLGATDRYVLWGYGSTGRLLCRALTEFGKRPSHIIELHPGRLGQRIQGAAVIPPEALREEQRGQLLVSVAGPKARAQIRQLLYLRGWREVRDFVWCA